ncbi:serine hydrolase domain-containing protein [Legionella pneumophila]|uniref:serine hydrolase domain-containing protein n=1 Tax=Legionella pneumophila TaxID=446 RepID=UPI0007707A46|nr:serine hydrolase domain-containing protein [Legionella pneumophila]CZL27319.1 beta-lactamase/D-alanine carboxypeptidase [Legionella pneumophila]
MPKPSIDALQKITEPAHIPAIGYAYVNANHSSDNTSITYGKKNAQSTKPDTNEVNDETRFPAASLSKIVFTFLVLRLVQEGHISLDEKLYKELPYGRVMEHGKYPDEATQTNAEKLTVRHVLSHTSGLPNVGSDPSSPLKFNSEPGTKYGYSGEGILYLQKVIEKKMKMDLQTLAQKYLFDPPPTGLDMTRSTFLPPSGLDTNIVSVHSELGKSMSIEESLAPFKDDTSPITSAVGTLLTTADDFSKFLTAWLKMMDDKDFKQAFEPPKDKKIPAFDGQDNAPPVCGLGWHLYNDEDGKLIAYQYGENTKMRAFVAINVTDKKGAAFFTNCEHGMSVANQIFSSPDLAPIGKTKQLFKSMPHHPQSDEPGWKETLAGKIAEDKAKSRIDIIKARFYFDKAAKLSPDDESKQRRLEWFDLVQESKQNKKEFTPALETFAGVYKNPFGEKREIYSKDGVFICKEFDREIKLMRISDTDFLPEKNQDFKVSIKGDQVTIHFLHGPPKYLFEQSLPESHEHASFFAALSKLTSHQPIRAVQPQHAHGVDVAVHEIQEAAKLGSTQEVTQRYRSALTEVRSDQVQSSEAVEETETKDNSPTSFQ